MASAAASVSIAAMTASICRTSIGKPTLAGVLSIKTNVRMFVTPGRGPGGLLTLGRGGPCILSLTSVVANNGRHLPLLPGQPAARGLETGTENLMPCNATCPTNRRTRSPVASGLSSR